MTSGVLDRRGSWHGLHPYDGADNECSTAGYDNDTFRCGYLGQVPLQDAPGIANIYCFGSAHPSGATFVFCDGSVHTVGFSIDSETHRRLANRADGLPLDATRFN